MYYRTGKLALYKEEFLFLFTISSKIGLQNNENMHTQ